MNRNIKTLIKYINKMVEDNKIIFNDNHVVEIDRRHVILPYRLNEITIYDIASKSHNMNRFTRSEIIESIETYIMRVNCKFRDKITQPPVIHYTHHYNYDKERELYIDTDIGMIVLYKYSDTQVKFKSYNTKHYEYCDYYISDIRNLTNVNTLAEIFNNIISTTHIDPKVFIDKLSMYNHLTDNMKIIENVKRVCDKKFDNNAKSIDDFLNSKDDE